MKKNTEEKRREPINETINPERNGSSDSLSPALKRKTASVIASVTMGITKDTVVMIASRIPYCSLDSCSV